MPTPVKVKSSVVKIDRFSDTITLYAFKPEGRVPLFRPGQFLHLAVDDYDGIGEWPESRIFSIASSPDEKDSVIRIVISVKGKFTSRVINKLKENDTVWLKLPYGDFIIKKSERTIVLIAGGTGITPFIPYLEQSLNQHSDQVIKLYYGVKNKKVIIFENLIENCKSKLEKFEANIYIEEDETQLKGAVKGIINKEKIFSDNKHEADYYLSGPPEMIKSLMEFFNFKGVPDENIHIDNWN